MNLIKEIHQYKILKFYLLPPIPLVLCTTLSLFCQQYVLSQEHFDCKHEYQKKKSALIYDFQMRPVRLKIEM